MKYVNVWTHPVTDETYRTTYHTRHRHNPKRATVKFWERHRLTAVDGDEPPQDYIGELYSRIPRVMDDDEDET